MIDDVLSWLDAMLERRIIEAQQREDRERCGVLKPFAPPFKDYKRETDYQWHTCRMRRATVKWIA